MKNGLYNLVIAPKEYPGKKYRDKYVYEHHIVWWKKHGVVIKKGLEIHHIDGNHRNNEIKNLILLTSAAHRKVHAELTRKPKVKITCTNCGIIFERPGTIARFKEKRKTSQFCSRQCIGKFGYNSVRGGRRTQNTVNIPPARIVTWERSQ